GPDLEILDSPALPGLIPPGQPSVEGVGPGRLRDVCVVYFDLGTQFGRRSGVVPADECLREPAGRLDVLPRHRLLREAGGFEGISVVPEVLVDEDPALPDGEDDCQLDVWL